MKAPKVAVLSLLAVLVAIWSASAQDTLCSKTTPCDSDHYCRWPVGMCGLGDGVCYPVPVGCTKELFPVCGCDGKTYPNKCIASMFNVSIEYEEKCYDKVCHHGGECNEAAGEYCMKTEGSCSGPGSCRGIPSICTNEYEPVCGCDGRTYSNRCFAAANNASVSFVGECAGRCITDTDCPGENAFCKYEIESCKPPGVCTVAPKFCMQTYRPVCGCNGRTYSNSCYATLAFASISVEGPCRADYLFKSQDNEQ